MSDRHRLSEHQARAQARAWLEQQHTDAHELLVTLLHYVPEADRTRALQELSTGELRRLARLLADATDLRQVARAIVADLQRHLPAQRRPNGSVSLLGRSLGDRVRLRRPASRHDSQRFRRLWLPWLRVVCCGAGVDLAAALLA
jgi:hypothetical protein